MEENDLLMLAAKAAGLEAGVIHQRPHRKCDMGWTPWNPLEDDGDALRLAARLKIDVHYEWNGPTMGDIVEAMSPERADGSRWCMDESTAEDVAAATRRAIVRAAAAMAA